MTNKKNLLIAAAILLVLGVSYYASRSTPPQNQVPESTSTPTQPGGALTTPNVKNNVIKGSTGTYYNKTISQAQAEALVKATWGDCSKVGCKSYVVTVSPNNLITAIYTVQSGSIYQLQKQAVATYSSGTWTLGATVTKQECWGGTHHADGSEGLSSSPCV